jgi:ribosome biogenesis protein Nip4
MKIDDFTKQFTDKKFDHVKQGDGYFTASKDVERTAEAITKKMGQQPAAVGLPLGKEDRGFRPSLFLLEELSKISSNKIFINDKAEWLFLCGRDVFEESIVRDETTGDIFLVQNERDENLGYAERVGHGHKILLKNLMDRGDFLRRER